jgi:ABC-2 type transport system permease protein
MRTLNLALKDLQQVIRDKRSLVFLVAMPLIFTLFMGFAYRGAVTPADSRLALGWHVEGDGGEISKLLQSSLEENPDLRLVVLGSNELEKARTQVTSGELAAILLLPDGFEASLLTETPKQLVLLADELSTVGQSAFQIVRGSVTRLMGSVEMARLNVMETSKRQTLSESEGKAMMSFSIVQAFNRWEDISASTASVTLENSYIPSEQELPLGGNPYNQTSPGILLQFAVFGLISSANIMVLERKTGALQRLATTSMHPAEIILGHWLAIFLVSFMQQALLVIFGQILLKVDYFRQPLAILVVVISLGACVSSLGLLISVVAHDESQVILYAMIAMFALSALGGAWFQLEVAGSTFSTIGHLLPSAWAMDGFQNILIRGQGIQSVLLPAAIMLGYGLLFFVAGVYLFRRSLSTS